MPLQPSNAGLNPKRTTSPNTYVKYFKSTSTYSFLVALILICKSVASKQTLLHDWLQLKFPPVCYKVLSLTHTIQKSPHDLVGPSKCLRSMNSSSCQKDEYCHGNSNV